MAKHFTPEEQSILKKNPYTKSVTGRQIIFTVPFKAMFAEQYRKGKTPRKILEEAGYDTNIFGEVRISGIQKGIMRQAGREEGFPEVPAGTAQADLKSLLGHPLSVKESDYLIHEVILLRQTLEVVKKTQFAIISRL